MNDGTTHEINEYAHGALVEAGGDELTALRSILEFDLPWTDWTKLQVMARITAIATTEAA